MSSMRAARGCAIRDALPYGQTLLHGAAGSPGRVPTRCAACRYKAEYRPSDLLCPSSHAWVPCSQLLRALDTHDGTADLCQLAAPHTDAQPAIPPCSLPGGPYAAIPWLPALQADGAFGAGDVLVLAQGALARMRHWLQGRVSERAAGQLRRLAEEVVSHMGPRAASQICIVFD